MTCACDNCGKTLPRAVYCDNKCKMAARRDTKSVVKTPIVSNVDTNRVASSREILVDDGTKTCTICDGKAHYNEGAEVHWCKACNIKVA